MHYNRIETYQLTPKNNEKEKGTVEQILANNKYDPHLLTIEPKKKKHDHSTQPQKQSWANFTYVGKGTRFITKLFKHTKVKVTFSTNNTISRHLTCEQNPVTYIRKMRSIPANLPRLQDDVHRTDWKIVQNQV